MFTLEPKLDMNAFAAMPYKTTPSPSVRSIAISPASAILRKRVVDITP
jgi:hypothetical protein